MIIRRGPRVKLEPTPWPRVAKCSPQIQHSGEKYPLVAQSSRHLASGIGVRRLPPSEFLEPAVVRPIAVLAEEGWVNAVPAIC